MTMPASNIIKSEQDSTLTTLSNENVKKYIREGDIMIRIPKGFWLKNVKEIFNLIKAISAEEEPDFKFLKDIEYNNQRIIYYLNEKFLYKDKMLSVLSKNEEIVFDKLVEFDKYMLFITPNVYYVLEKDNISFKGLFFNNREKEDDRIVLARLQIYYHNSKLNPDLEYKLKKQEKIFFKTLPWCNNLQYESNTITYPYALTNIDNPKEVPHKLTYLTPHLELISYYYKNRVKFENVILYEDISEVETQSNTGISIMLPSPIIKEDKVLKDKLNKIISEI